MPTKQPHSLESAIKEGFRQLGITNENVMLEHLKPMTGQIAGARLKFNAITKIGYHVTITIPNFPHQNIQAIAWESTYGCWVTNATAKTLYEALNQLYEQLCKFPNE